MVLAFGHDSTHDCMACEGGLGDTTEHWWLWVDPAIDPALWVLPPGWVLA
jgi:hypothetical protein